MSGVLDMPVPVDPTAYEVIQGAITDMLDVRSMLRAQIEAAKVDPIGTPLVEISKTLLNLSKSAEGLGQQLRMCEEAGKKRAKKMSYAQQVDEFLVGFSAWPAEARRLLAQGLTAIDAPQEKLAAMK